MYKVALNRTWLLCDTQLLCCEMAEQARSYCKQENLWGPAMNKEKHKTKGLGTIVPCWSTEILFCNIKVPGWVNILSFALAEYFVEKNQVPQIPVGFLQTPIFSSLRGLIKVRAWFVFQPFSLLGEIGKFCRVGGGRIWLIHPPARIPTCSKLLQDSLDRFNE